MSPQGEVDLFGAEGAGLLDVELVPSLCDGDFQVVMLSQFPLHDVNACTRNRKANTGP